MDKTLFIYMQMNGGEIGLMLTEKKEEEEILNCASCGSHGRRVTQLWQHENARECETRAVSLFLWLLWTHLEVLLSNQPIQQQS